MTGGGAVNLPPVIFLSIFMRVTDGQLVESIIIFQFPDQLCRRGFAPAYGRWGTRGGLHSPSPSVVNWKKEKGSRK